MVKIVEMDDNVTLKAQLEEDVGPFNLLNKFTVKPEDVNQFLKVFTDTSKMFKQQPGFISAARCTEGLVVVVHSLTMLFGSLQNTLNRPLIVLSSGRAWPTFSPIP